MTEMRVRIYNYREGEFSYGQRIAISRIWREELREYEKLKLVWKELYGYDCRVIPVRKRVRLLLGLADGLRYWFDLEQRTLATEPTQEQLRAGIRELSEKIGDMGTVTAIAKDYGVDPDVVLTWQWGKVYGILLTDVEQYRYEKKLSDIMSKKR